MKDISDHGFIDRAFQNIWNLIYYVWIIYFSILFILPYYAYSYVRDGCRNIVTEDTIYIKELNVDAFSAPELDKSGFGMYYGKVRTIAEAEEWLEKNGYQSKEIETEKGYRLFFVKPSLGVKTSKNESVVNLLIDYGDGSITDLINSDKYKIDVSKFPLIKENPETRNKWEKIDRNILEFIGINQ